MKRFTFKLQALLKIRKEREEQVKLLLAEKNREIIEKKKELNNYYQQLHMLQSSEKERRPEVTQVLLMRYSVVHRHTLKAAILRIGRCIDDLRSQAATIQQDLVNATKERRALEIIRDKQLTAWKKEYRREEQNFIDDVAQQKYINSHK
jgi:flagellar protein FliJ